MRIVIFLVFILVLLANPWEIRGQQADQSSSPSVSEIPTTSSLLFNTVLVYRREGGPLYGLLVRVESNAMIIRAGGKDEKIPLTNLAKVIIETEKKTGLSTLYSMLMGTYLGNLLFFRAKNQPTAYMEDIESGLGFFLTNTLFAAVGGGLGYLISSIYEKGERAFDFTGSKEKKQAEWERLRRFVAGELRPRKVHLSIQAGHVFTRVSPQYLNSLQNAGYWVSHSSYLFGDYSEEAKDFNLFRNLKLTYSLKSNTEIGFALYWLGEPSMGGSKWESGQSSEVGQSLYTTGYYVVGMYKPFLKRMPKRIAWNVGVGVGAAKVDFNLKALITTWDPDTWNSYEEVTTEHNISKTFFSGVIFTELNLYLQDGLSLGLTADYVFVPAENVPEIPEAGILAQKLRLGNGSIGFTLGWHF